MTKPLSGDGLRKARELFAAALHEKGLREERRRQSDLGEKGRLGGLIHFIRYFWRLLEPNTPFVEGWALEAMCLHLEAVTRGEITRLVINVSPGFMKSLLCNVFWPAWEWSAAGRPFERYVTFAYARHLTERDNTRFRDIVRTDLFRELWGHTFELVEDGKIKPVNDKTGFKFASSVGGVGTGERGSKLVNDDLHNVKEGESETVRTETVRWAREAMSNRLTNMATGAIIAIGQRVHDEDVSAALLKTGRYVHLVIPMEYDPQWHCSTGWWEDPRTEYGELAWPERFPKEVVADIKTQLGPYAYSAQYQQNPEPRGGGILKRDWWVPYEVPAGTSLEFGRKFDLIIGSLDPAFTSKQENDPSGWTAWGVYYERGAARVVLLGAWQKWLEMNGKMPERLPGEKHKEYQRRSSKDWGLTQWIKYECDRCKVRVLLVEAKASGHTVVQELRRLYGDENFQILLIDPGAQDKRARAYSIQHLFAAGMVMAPASVSDDMLIFREFAQTVIDECAKFRGLAGEEDNLVDSTTQALRWMRDRNFLTMDDERSAIERYRAENPTPAQRPSIYDV